MVNPDVMLDGKGIIIISSDDDETECNEAKLLKEMHIVDGCILKVDDFFQNYELTITIIHKTAERDDPKFEIVADKDVLKTAESVEEVKKQKEEESLSQPQPGPSNGASSSSNGEKSKAYESDEDDLIIVEPQPVAEKRKHSEDGEDESPNCKRVRVEEPIASSSQASTIVDDDDDLICIDDD
jgi:ubiquitin-like 1-activating enzyme E1 B